MKNHIKKLLTLGIETQTVILFFTLLAAVWIGIVQNNINNELKNIAFKDLISSKSPLLDVDFYKFEYDPIHKSVTRDLKFSNKGLVPLNILNYEVDYPQNILKLAPYEESIPGTLFQGESVVKGTLSNEGIMFQDLQLITVKAKFVSIFDVVKQFCVERKYLFDSKRSQLQTLQLTIITECK